MVLASANELEARYKLLQLERKVGKKRLHGAKEHLLHVEEARVIAQTTAQRTQEEAHRHISSIVSKCLEAIFPDPYGFRILFEKKRGKTEARMVFLRDGNEVDPQEAAGGGALDVAAFALRLAALVLARPARRRLLVLDEPFKNLSAGYRGRAADLLLCLAEEMGIQFVMVTHFSSFQVGKVVQVPPSGSSLLPS